MHTFENIGNQVGHHIVCIDTANFYYGETCIIVDKMKIAGIDMLRVEYAANRNISFVIRSDKAE